MDAVCVAEILNLNYYGVNVLCVDKEKRAWCVVLTTFKKYNN